ncbi:MAG TPA: hypothetical protein DCW71_01530 [Alistipes sp.]|nr:hypothetical protein [Alistipes sp.]
MMFDLRAIRSAPFRYTCRHGFRNESHPVFRSGGIPPAGTCRTGIGATIPGQNVSAACLIREPLTIREISFA